jgi:hypothetical protein
VCYQEVVRFHLAPLAMALRYDASGVVYTSGALLFLGRMGSSASSHAVAFTADLRSNFSSSVCGISTRRPILENPTFPVCIKYRSERTLRLNVCAASVRLYARRGVIGRAPICT